jgi:hypothetical protein
MDVLTCKEISDMVLLAIYNKNETIITNNAEENDFKS